MKPEPSIWSLFDKPEEPQDDRQPVRQPSIFDLFGKEGPDGGGEDGGQEPPEPPPNARAFDERSFYWTLRDLPLKEATKHMLVCGMIGSGKTTLIRLFLNSIAPRFRPGRERPEQLIVFDAKGDMIPLLAELKLNPGMENFWFLHPADARGNRWNIAEAAKDPLHARHVATLLVPEEKHSSAPYFADAARELVFASILALNTRGKQWTFRDLLCSLDSVERVRAVTKLFPPAFRIASRIIEDEKHASGVLSTLGARLGRFEQVAALWSAEEGGEFSITEFLKRPGVLVLSNDATLRDSIWPINALLLKALTDEILSQPETQLPRFWFVLDEFRAMQNVPCMHDLLNRGRSKGAAVLLGAQSIEGIVEVYQDQGANDLLSQCAYKTFLRAGGPVTGEWAERYFHKVRAMERTVSESWGAQGRSTSQQWALQERSLFLSATFQDLPLPEPGGWLTAISDVPCLRQVRISTHCFDQLLARRPDSPAADVRAFEPHTDGRPQWLKPWSKDEIDKHTKPPEAAVTGSDAASTDAAAAGSNPASSDPRDRTDRRPTSPPGSGAMPGD